MLAVVFRRHLREGVRYEEYVDAWRAEKGYGVRARVLNATSLDDEREVLTVGFVGISTHAMKLAQRFLQHHDESRHDRIEDVIDAPPKVARAETIAEHHLGSDSSARPIRVGSRESMLHLTHAHPSDEPPSPSPWIVLACARRLHERPDRRLIESARTPPADVDGLAVLIDARGVDEQAELVSVLFVRGATDVPGWAREWLDSGLEPLTADVEWTGAYRVRDEHDFQKDPISVPLGAGESLLSF